MRFVMAGTSHRRCTSGASSSGVASVDRPEVGSQVAVGRVVDVLVGCNRSKPLDLLHRLWCWYVPMACGTDVAGDEDRRASDGLDTLSWGIVVRP